MSDSSPGADGTPLPGGAWVLRLAIPSYSPDEPPRCSPNAFELSSADKQQPVPRLSVFAEELTSPKQAYELVGNPNRSRAFRLSVDDIRVEAASDALEVEWERAHRVSDGGEVVPDDRPGALGHAGITNLGREDLHTRAQRKWLRGLADFSRFVCDLSESEADNEA
jgi:hypothetical protein